MTKSTITREQLLEIIETDHVQCGEASYLARMALSAMDGEPVGYFGRFDPDDEDLIDQCSKNVKGAFPLYLHAQQPVVMDDIKLRELFDSWFASDCSFDRSPEASEEGNIAWRESYWYVWQRCRAAMLQAGTLTNEDTKQAWTGIPDIDNAINMLDRIDTLESCDDDRIEAVKTVLRRLAGNSPVIPDGYVMVPKEPTAQMYDAGDRQMTTKQVWDAMLAAATQLPGSEPAAVPGRWIPVSERMPEDRISVILWDAEIGEVTSGHYSHKTQTFYHCGDAIENEITHWIPPPCAPQEVKGE